jgi:adenylate cyclase
VLPLQSISPDPNDEYFADGMTEELIDRLAQVKSLKVIARTSVMSYKKKEKKASEIARELEVGTLIEGSVRKAGNRVRVTVQLINAGTQEHLWSSRYDKNLDDIFAVQSEDAYAKLNCSGGAAVRTTAYPTEAMCVRIPYGMASVNRVRMTVVPCSFSAGQV